MDREGLRSFIKSAEAALMSARGSLLLISQGGAKFDLAPLAAQLSNIGEISTELGLEQLAAQARFCQKSVVAATTSENAYRALDAIALVEAELLSISLPDEIADIEGFIDNSFGEILHEHIVETAPEFEIDDETLEIFRSEGEELLANITLAIDMLAASPSDQTSLWDIRRSAHTFKGAAGIVGLGEASSLAHRMEDLLDRLVESSGYASPAVLDFMRGCVRSLRGVLDSHPANAAGLELAYSSAVSSLEQRSANAGLKEHKLDPAHDKPTENKRVARVSLERIGEIVMLAEQLLTSQAEFNSDTRKLVLDIHDRLVRLRLIKFGNLENRLARAVNITASEEDKRAVLDIETPDVEIDTLVLDGLVEPLLHLIKNAVVHGIEPPEVRRMLGKHEFGLISIRVDADSEAVVVTVADDGGGIAVDKLKHRAIDRNLISDQTAGTMSDRDAYKLLFDKGLTTTDTITLNAGRGVGMSIVKESIESRGGSIHIESTPQLGTTFTLMLPTGVGIEGGNPRVATPCGGLRVSKGVTQESGAIKNSITDTQPASLPTLASTAPLILIVDDSASIRRVTQTIVENAGLRTITAKDGADALELLLNSSVEPDLILSDVEMPNVDGWELLKYIKTDEHFGHIPVVLVTSLNGDDHRSLATSLGAADYIVKPFSSNDIDRVLALVTANTAA